MDEAIAYGVLGMLSKYHNQSLRISVIEIRSDFLSFNRRFQHGYGHMCHLIVVDS